MKITNNSLLTNYIDSVDSIEFNSEKLSYIIEGAKTYVTSGTMSLDLTRTIFNVIKNLEEFTSIFFSRWKQILINAMFYASN